MSQIQKKTVSDDLSLYSLNKFYKTCMSLLSKQSTFNEMEDRENMFMSCYIKLNKVYLLTNHYLNKSSPHENERTDTEII